jgi:Tol biopolymer transport system component
MDVRRVAFLVVGLPLVLLPALAGRASGAGAPAMQLAVVGARGITFYSATGAAECRLRLRIAANPAWSPDDSTLAYVDDNAGGEVVAISTPCQPQARRRVLATGCDGCPFAWSPDGATLAYARLAGERSTVVLRQLASSAERTIARLPGAAVAAIAWSHDGTTLALRLTPPHNSNATLAGALVTLRADGSQRHVLLAGGVAELSGWSRDGRRILFTLAHAYSSEVATVERDGTHVRRLAGGHGAVYSPDGTLIAYLVHRAGLYLMRADGGGRRRLVAASDYQPAGASWSPDGLHIAFTPDFVALVVADPQAATAPRVLSQDAEPEAIAWAPR